MRLLEYQAKDLLRRFDIPIPDGYVAGDTSAVRRHEDPVVIKAQVPIGGRGKAGGILFAPQQGPVMELVERLLSSEIRGYRVNQVLIEPVVRAERELYLGIALDRLEGLPLLMVSGEGGMDIESIPDRQIERYHLHPFVGIRDYMIRRIARSLSLDEGTGAEMTALLRNLWRLYDEYDCELVEINPLMVTGGELIAGDAKIIINDDSLFKHPDMPRDEVEVTELEREARAKGIAFVQLDGNIGVIANGAGLTMATLDSLSLHGGRGGVFLDLGGTDDVDTVVEAFSLLVRARPGVILLNIFGGITKCDTVAKGVVAAKRRLGIDIPVVARIRGVNEEEARRILKEESIHAVRELGEAARLASQMEGSG